MTEVETIRKMMGAPAVFSGCRNYRYWLRRDLDMMNKKPLLWFMINPSLATESADDPTTRVVCNFALRWGFGIHAAVNGFAAITLNPKVMMAMDDPVGPDNDRYIKAAIQWCDDNGGRIITAWGNPGTYRNRHLEIMEMLKGRKLLRLGVNKNGTPKFPYAIRKDVEPEEWRI